MIEEIRQQLVKVRYENEALKDICMAYIANKETLTPGEYSDLYGMFVFNPMFEHDEDFDNMFELARNKVIGYIPVEIVDIKRLTGMN